MVATHRSARSCMVASLTMTTIEKGCHVHDAAGAGAGAPAVPNREFALNDATDHTDPRIGHR